MEKVDLSVYTPGDYKPGAGILKRVLWFITNALFFQCPLSTLSTFKCFLLRMFGAKVGKGVVIKPSVNIKYPWKLQIGDHVWIGEKAWIDNLDEVVIGSHCCISQGAMLLCGNHNYRKKTFDLMTGRITLEDGVWIGAFSIVSPGVTCGTHSVLAVNSVASNDLEPYYIYRGNPAIKTRERKIQ
ncbi:MAG: WcaF family extracellular polysaccharide biosynthesis acetyltransferase [Bacteroidetes bacterium]|nr:WcaF family extracellular polysaccharide biosynthesis acetyltransferase [Bacteroidota bacterium]